MGILQSTGKPQLNNHLSRTPIELSNRHMSEINKTNNKYNAKISIQQKKHAIS